MLKVFLGMGGPERAGIEFRQGGLREVKLFEGGELRDEGIAIAEVTNNPRWCPTKRFYEESPSIRSASAFTARSNSSPSSPAMHPAVASKAARRRSRLLGLRPWT